jgi:hypothetical protein
LETCGTFLSPDNVDTILAAYDACEGNELDCDDDCTSGGGDPAATCRDENQTGGGATRDSCLCIDVTAGQTIFIKASGFFGDAGDITLNVIPLGCPPPVGRCCSNNGAICDDITEAECDGLGGSWTEGLNCTDDPCPLGSNDLCDDARDITELPYSDLGVDMPGATDDANVNPSCDSGSSCGAGPAKQGVWWTYTPPTNCVAGITVSGVDTATTIWTGADCNNLTQVLCSDPQSASFAMTGGTQYWILVSKWSCSTPAAAPINFTFDCVLPPDNDDCGAASVVTEGVPAAEGNNCAAGADLVEAGCQANSNKDVWFEYTASCTANVTVNTEGSGQSDTVLSVYDSCGGAQIACDDDAGSGNLSTVTFAATMGENYLIRVASFSTGCGAFDVNISCGVLLGLPDFDLDGDIDLVDFAEIQVCMTPDGGLRAGCEMADLVEDGTLDLADYEQFSKYLHGPAEMSK